jgi:lipoprotein-anchoring transpeptidase ErfK/SrfK
MRRLVALPVKTSAVMVIILAVYVAAEARQAVVQRRQLELVRLERTGSTGGVQNRLIGRSGDLVMGNHPATALAKIPTNVAAEHQAPQLSAQKALQQDDEHKRQIIISIADRRLALLEDGKLVKTYPIAVGARFSPSPDGEFTIINHAVDPVYRHKGKEIQPGKDNPLGNRWMGLSLKGYGIHGTNVQSSVGKAVSHGCFRMARQDVEDLYSHVQVGDTVIIRRDRDELIARTFAPQLSEPGKKTSGEAQVASAVGADSSPSASTGSGQ